MNMHVRALLQSAVVGGVVFGAVFWLVPGRTFPIEWAMRILLPSIAILAWGVLRWHSRRPEIFHDFLADVTRRYFEWDGLCFALLVDVCDGCCRLNFYFQNRYRGRCHCRITLHPMALGLVFLRPKMAPIEIDFISGGGEFGVARALCAVPDTVQNRRGICKISICVDYPDGRGETLRYRVGSHVSANLPRGGYINQPIRFPGSVAEQVVNRPPAIEILSTPDLPIGGFPVIPVNMPDDPPPPRRDTTL